MLCVFVYWNKNGLTGIIGAAMTMTNPMKIMKYPYCNIFVLSSILSNYSYNAPLALYASPRLHNQFSHTQIFNHFSHGAAQVSEWERGRECESERQGEKVERNFHFLLGCRFFVDFMSPLFFSSFTTIHNTFSPNSIYFRLTFIQLGTFGSFLSNGRTQYKKKNFI